MQKKKINVAAREKQIECEGERERETGLNYVKKYACYIQVVAVFQGCARGYICR